MAAFCPKCGTSIGPEDRFCGGCGAPVGEGAPPPAPGPPAPVGPAPHRPSGGSTTRTLLIVGAVVLALVAAGVVAVLVLRDGGDAPTAAGEVFLEAVGSPVPDAFSPPMLQAAETVPMVSLPAIPELTGSDTGATTAPTVAPTVAGTAPGLYGGTRDTSRCDAGQLVSFLDGHPAEAAAWAAVHGIAPADIGTYVAGLTPVVLIRDTRVTNHGFRDGRATPRQAVLQAGTAVLVDATGVPRVKCACGNPLAPPTAAPIGTVTGNRWSGFDPAVVVVVVAGPPTTEFVVVDVTTGRAFGRKPGPTVVDADVPADRLCDLFPDDPACSDAPVAEPELLFSIDSILGADKAPTNPSVAVFDRAVTITLIRTYHWNDGQGSPPGTLGLRGPDGTMYGPYPVTRTLEGQGGVPNAYWELELDLSVPPGSYEIIDSDPGTWAQNDETGNRGIVHVYGYTAGPSIDPEATPGAAG